MLLHVQRGRISAQSGFHQRRHLIVAGKEDMRSISIRQCHLLNSHAILKSIELEVFTKDCTVPRIRFERYDPSLRANQRAKENRVLPDVPADIEHEVARLEPPPVKL